MEFCHDVSLEWSTLASTLAERVKAYFQDPQHRKEFEDWYRQKHGKDYEWKNAT